MKLKNTILISICHEKGVQKSLTLIYIGIEKNVNGHILGCLRPCLFIAILAIVIWNGQLRVKHMGWKLFEMSV